MKKTLTLFILIIITSVVLSADIEEITIVGEKNYFPFEFEDETGVSRGILVDIWSLWANKTNIRIDYKTYNTWETVMNSVKSGEGDVVSLMFYTPERDEHYDFSIPYYEMKSYIFFNDYVFGIKDMNDISGFKVGVVEDDYAVDFIKQKNIDVKLQKYPSVEKLVQGAIDGKISIFIADGPVGRYYLSKKTAGDVFRHSREPLYTNPVYAAVAEGNNELLTLINDGLTQITRDEIENIVSSWTGTSLKEIIPWEYVIVALIFFGTVLLLIIIWNIQLRNRIEDATKEITEKNRELETKNKELAQTKNNLINMNEELQEQLDENKNLTMGMESILTVTSKMSQAAKGDPDEFLDSILKMLIRLIPNADYGSISLFEDEQWRIVSAIGHDVEKLKTLKLDVSDHIPFDKTTIIDNIIDKDQGFLMSEEKASGIESATKPISSSLITGLKIGERRVGSIILDMDKNNEESFTSEDVRIMEAFSNVVSSFLGMQQYMISQGKFQKQLILSMIQILELHDPYTKGHSENVANLSAEIARKMKFDKEIVQKIYWAGLVHDIGKILIPNTLLCKPGKLTDDEFDQLKRHPELGAKVLTSSDELKNIVRTVKHHHERWDGSGYPERLAGTRIPREARIIAVADAFDAMINDRPYRKGLPWETAIKEIEINAGKQFEPEAAHIFLRYLKEEGIEKTTYATTLHER